jgi:hypothetical protein
MEAGTTPQRINVARALPIDGALLGDALLRLRRDAGGAPLRWNLGDRGAVEIDVNFVSSPEWHTTVRVWDTGGLALATCTLDITTAVDRVTVQLTVDHPLLPWWAERIARLLDLVQASLDELAEELLWHASRAAV